MITKEDCKRGLSGFAYLAAVLFGLATLGVLLIAWGQWLAAALGVK